MELWSFPKHSAPVELSFFFSPTPCHLIGQLISVRMFLREVATTSRNIFYPWSTQESVIQFSVSHTMVLKPQPSQKHIQRQRLLTGIWTLNKHIGLPFIKTHPIPTAEDMLPLDTEIWFTERLIHCHKCRDILLVPTRYQTFPLLHNFFPWSWRYYKLLFFQNEILDVGENDTHVYEVRKTLTFFSINPLTVPVPDCPEAQLFATMSVCLRAGVVQRGAHFLFVGPVGPFNKQDWLEWYQDSGDEL